MLRTSLVRLTLALAAAPLVVAGANAHAVDPPLPTPLGSTLTVAALGDSVTTAWGSGAAPGDNWAGSWATGTDAAVDSHLARIDAMRTALGLAPASVVELAHPGSRIVSSNGIDTQAESVPATADLVLIENGSADLCASSVVSVSDLSSSADYGAAMHRALQTITDRAPQAKIFVASIPDWYTLWQRLPGMTRTPDTCPLLFSSDPAVANDASRAAVRSATDGYNAATAAACAAFPACRYDGGAVFGVLGSATAAELPTLVSPVDGFHPSLAGQHAVAEQSWPTSWFAAPISTSPPTIAPAGAPAQGAVLTASPGGWTGSPTFAYDWRRCTGSSCSSVGTGPTYTVVPADAGQTLLVAVTASNSAGATTAVSAATAAAAAPVTTTTSTTTTATTTSTTTTATTTTTSTTTTAPAVTTTSSTPATTLPTVTQAATTSSEPTPEVPVAIVTGPAASSLPTGTVGEPLEVTIASPLVAHVHGSVVVLRGTIGTKAATTLVVTAFSTGKPLTFLRKSAVESAVTGRRHVRIVYRPKPGDRTAGVVLRFAAPLGGRPGSYRLVVTAAGASGEVASTRSAFTVAP